MSSTRKENKRRILQAVLFITTFITTTFAGSEWVYSKPVFLTDYTWQDFVDGMAFSVPLLLILTVHEFGHYFMAMYHKIKTSLPYYIPIPPIPYLGSLGTFGAVIRLRQKPQTSVQSFDIGIAGPLAGFVVAVALLVYGFATLPPAEYVYQFHPEYEKYGLNYADHVYNYDTLKTGEMAIDTKIGTNLMFVIAEQFVEDRSRIPNSRELMHYPLLFAVFFALFFTSLNLIPIGQFDGGHAVYGLFGFKIHKIISTVFFIGLMFYGGLGNPYIKLDLPSSELAFNTTIYILILFFALTSLGLQRRDTVMYTLIIVASQFVTMALFPGVSGYFGWQVIGFLLARIVGLYHPQSEIELPMDFKRVVLGWVTLLIFILCFSPSPIYIEVITGQ